jgi:FkbH-like protein
MEETRNGRRIALLSNVNMNALIRMLQKDAEVYEAEGYGNELGTLMNPASSYHAFQPEMTFLVVDLLELLEHELEEQAVRSRIQGWFAGFENAMSESCVYYINDAFLWGAELEAADALTDRTVPEGIWNAELKALCARHANVRILPYHRLIVRLGEENAFSPKMWYMGRILLSGEAQKRLAALILDKVELESRTPKKVLVLDLDNTLWGGLAGENDHTPIQLSEEHSGLAYKNLQRVILQMQKQGVLLAIVSKNNPEDAEAILQGHPHMVLRPEHFAAKRINWKPKNENMMEIAGELNLGADSFVFWDDNPQERLLISQTLPQVAVPDFPAKPEELAPAMTAVYHTYFEKAVLTAEDLNKTVQYAANNKRRELQQAAGNFADYLKQLQIVVTRVDAAAHFNRLEALLNKTNQFNLTTRRHDTKELQNLIQNKAKRIFLYRVEDCFGDNGLVAAVIVDAAEKVPVIEEFVMSCRVMGKNIEQGILSHVEGCLREEGFERVRGVYVPTAKNKPVAGLYEQMGYREIDGGTADNVQHEEKIYELTLSAVPERAFVGTFCTEEK